MTPPRRTKLAFSDLAGWHKDDHAAARLAFDATAHCLPKEWAGLLADDPDPRRFFEKNFLPLRIEDNRPCVITGYYEPELDAALSPSPDFPAPIYAAPSGWTEGKLGPSRAEIEMGNLLAGHEIAWLRHPVEAFFLQVQGSGRLRLPDGSTLRVGYAGKNGHPYVSIGKTLVASGAIDQTAISADAIKDWVRANPVAGREVLQKNPSFVFFRVLDLDPDLGPIGAAGAPVTALRTLAIDPEFTPYGAPVWIEKSDPDPINRLMVAQDTGSAIRGPQRADIFFGTGEAAGKSAGRTKEGGRLIVLWPKGIA